MAVATDTVSPGSASTVLAALDLLAEHRLADAGVDLEVFDELLAAEVPILGWLGESSTTMDAFLHDPLGALLDSGVPLARQAVEALARLRALRPPSDDDA